MQANNTWPQKPYPITKHDAANILQSSAALVTDGCVEVETSSPAADVDVAELEACAGSADAASMSSSSSLASGANWNASVYAEAVGHMVRKNCICV